jgi:hypothetical protein
MVISPIMWQFHRVLTVLIPEVVHNHIPSQQFPWLGTPHQEWRFKWQIIELNGRFSTAMFDYQRIYICKKNTYITII